MINDIPFKSITPNAQLIFDKVLKNQNLVNALNKKLTCACLGPNERDEFYNFRVCCLNHLNEQKHFAFFPEQINKKDASLILNKTKLNDIQKRVILDDENILNQILVSHSDLVFSMCSGQGVFVEIGRYGKIIPNKLILLIPNQKYHENSQVGLDVKTLSDLYNKNCLITFKNESDLREKINKCLVLELRRSLWEGNI